MTPSKAYQPKVASTRRLGRKAVSELVAAMIMISIVVAAAFIIYVYSSSVTGSLMGAQPQQPYANQITAEYYSWPCTTSYNGTCTALSTSITLALRNTGSGQGFIADYFVNGTAVTTVTYVCPATTITGTTNLQLMPGNSCTATLTVPTTVSNNAKPGYAYIVKLVTTNGSVFTFNVIAGQSGTPTA